MHIYVLTYSFEVSVHFAAREHICILSGLYFIFTHLLSNSDIHITQRNSPKINSANAGLDSCRTPGLEGMEIRRLEPVRVLLRTVECNTGKG